MERLETKEKWFEIVKTSKRDGFYYSDGNFEYTPPGWVKIEERWYPLGYRLVRPDLTSLRLKRNPTPLQYYIGKWVKLPKNELVAEMVDIGGIFSGAGLGEARKTEASCLSRQKDPFQPLFFYAALYRPIAANSYAVKSQGLMLLEELK